MITFDVFESIILIIYYFNWGGVVRFYMEAWLVGVSYFARAFAVLTVGLWVLYGEVGGAV